LISFLKLIKDLMALTLDGKLIMATNVLYCSRNYV